MAGVSSINQRRQTNARRRRIAEILQGHPSASIRQVAEEMGLPPKAIWEHLREMERRGRIARRECLECGSPKWEVRGEGGAG